jgi:hypothetical protein
VAKGLCGTDPADACDTDGPAEGRKGHSSHDASAYQLLVFQEDRLAHRRSLYRFDFFWMCLSAAGGAFRRFSGQSVKTWPIHRERRHYMLGKPISVSTNADGSQVLQWYYVYGTAIGVGGGAHAAVLFAPDGKMVRVTHLFQE